MLVKDCLTAETEGYMNEYYAQNGEKLHTMVNSILKKFGGITDYDHFYSLANIVFCDVLTRYDSEQNFHKFLYSCLCNKIKTDITKKNRIKRKADRDTVSISMPVGDEENSTIEDFLESDIDVYQIVENQMGVVSETTEEYLETLSDRQKQIATLIMDGCKTCEIREILGLTEKEYNDAMSDMRSYEKKNIFERRESNSQEVEDLSVQATATTEKGKSTSYSIEALSKKIRKYQIRDNHPLQRYGGQWTGLDKSELVSDVLQGNMLTQIIISEEIKDDVVMHWLIDGKQRCTNLDSYLNDGFRISKNVQIHNIEYQTNKTDEDGNQVFNEEGFPVMEKKVFDIRNKLFSQLPEELQDKFKEYQYPVLLRMNCTKKEIAYDIARFNRGRRMNAAQNGWTNMDENFAVLIDGILKMQFFKSDNETSTYKAGSVKNSSLRRIIVESIILSYFPECYVKDFTKMCKSLSEEANDSTFIEFYELIERLSKVATPDVAEFFTEKDTMLWFSTFSKFVNLNLPDERFIDFLLAFKSKLHNANINGTTYDEICKSKSTKQRNIVLEKVDIIYRLMLRYFGLDRDTHNIEETHSDDVENNDPDNANNMSDEEFISEMTGVEIEDVKECMDVYVQTLDDLTDRFVPHDSKLMDSQNRLPMLAMVVHSYADDVDLEEWIEWYAKENDVYIPDRQDNYLYMVASLNDYIRYKKVEGWNMEAA